MLYTSICFKLALPPFIDLNARIDAHCDEPCKTLVDDHTE